MSRPRVALTLRSVNKKTGPIPVSTTEAGTCPASCPLSGGGGCYAAQGKLALFWAKVNDGRAGLPWAEFLAKVRALPAGQLWRHNQAGDLPGESNRIDAEALAELVDANRGRAGFTYTHKPALGANRRAIDSANKGGFAVNLSADDLHEADQLARLGIGPVVTLLPSDQLENTHTPAGRKVVVCPAVTHENVTCASCKLCARIDRPVIIGFPAHGTQHKKASAIAQGANNT